MQGCGNDFVILLHSEYEKGVKGEKWKNMSDAAKKLCDRNFGVGADGLIIPNTNTEGAVINLSLIIISSSQSSSEIACIGSTILTPLAEMSLVCDVKQFVFSPSFR